MAVRAAVRWTFRVTSDNDLFKHADDIMRALLAQEQGSPGLLDSAVSADRSQGIIEIDVTAEGETFEEAAERGHAAVATAVESTGGRIRSHPVPTSMSTEQLASV